MNIFGRTRTFKTFQQMLVQNSENNNKYINKNTNLFPYIKLFINKSDNL